MNCDLICECDAVTLPYFWSWSLQYFNMEYRNRFFRYHTGLWFFQSRQLKVTSTNYVNAYWIQELTVNASPIQCCDLSLTFSFDFINHGHGIRLNKYFSMHTYHHFQTSLIILNTVSSSGSPSSSLYIFSSFLIFILSIFQ